MIDKSSSIFADQGAWGGHIDNYAQFMKAHPECDKSADNYNQEQDWCYWQERRNKETQRYEDSKFANLPIDEQFK